MIFDKVYRFVIRYEWGILCQIFNYNSTTCGKFYCGCNFLLCNFWHLNLWNCIKGTELKAWSGWEEKGTWESVEMVQIHFQPSLLVWHQTWTIYVTSIITQNPIPSKNVCMILKKTDPGYWKVSIKVKTFAVYLCLCCMDSWIEIGLE